MKKYRRYFWGILSLILGIYFSYLCFENVGRMGWDIFNLEAQNVTPRHGWGEDLSQFILCLMGAVVCLGTSFCYLFLFKDDMLFFDDDE